MKRARGKEVYIIAGVVAVVLIVAWYFLLFSPVQNKIADLDSQIAADQTTYTTLKNQLSRLQDAQRTAPQARAELVRLGKMLPQSEGIPSLIIELTRTASESGVTLSSITRGATQTGTPYGVQTVTLAVTGVFFDVEDFVYRLEDYVAFHNASFRVTGRLLQIINLGLTRGTVTPASAEPPLTVAVTLDAYLWGGLTGGTAP